MSYHLAAPSHLSVWQVQSTIGHSDYVQRDQALRLLVQPLAGEYGMHNDEPQGTASCQNFHNCISGLQINLMNVEEDILCGLLFGRKGLLTQNFLCLGPSVSSWQLRVASFGQF